MTGSELPPALMIMTFGIILVGLIVAFVLFMRKKSNRNSMEHTPERGEPGAPDKPRGEPINR